jgi:hypothetical protein
MSTPEHVVSERGRRLPDRHGGAPTHNGGALCIEVPELVRLRYFYGQMLGAADFQAEQDYFREKLKLHNRCLHGYGVVCGLEVVPEEREEDCVPPTPEERPVLEQRRRDLEKRRQEAAQLGRPSEALAALDQQIAEIQRRLDCLPRDETTLPPSRVHIECGLAYDCEGNELVVRHALVVDLLAMLDASDARRARSAARAAKAPIAPSPAQPTPSRPTKTGPVQTGPVQPVPTHPEPTQAGTLYVSLCYCAQPVGPVRPVLAEACGAMPDCTFGKLRDAVRVRVTLEEPEGDERCEPCCEECRDACVLLARIDDFTPGEPLRPEQIHNEVRRYLAPYALTRVAGVSWTHAATYTDDEAADLLGRDTTTGGLEIRFSRSVLSSTITDGVVDVWVIEGGRGRHADLYSVDVEIDTGTGRFTDRMIIRQTTGERMDDGDRILIQLRTSFILDACCYAVDGENIGGRVPLLAGYERFRRGDAATECRVPRRGSVPWMSGNGMQAGTFESWFYIGSGDTGGGGRPSRAGEVA